MFARVVNLATGAVNSTPQIANAALAAYPGGPFASDETYETEPYFNRVLVLPVSLSDLGIDQAAPTLAYRGVTGVSRLPLLVEQPMGEPVDTTDWVTIDASTSPISLPDSYDGSPLHPSDASSLAIDVSADVAAQTRLLVLHHANGGAPRYEVVDLAKAELEGSDLAVSCTSDAEVALGQPATATCTVTNSADSARAGVQLAVSASGGSIQALSASVGTCTSSSCDLGELAAGASATITVSGAPSAAGAFSVTATVSSEFACDTDATNDEATATFTVTSGADAGLPDSGADDSGAPSAAAPASDDSGGCGCRQASSHPGRGWMALGLLFAAALLRRRPRRI